MERYRSLVDLLFRNGEREYGREKAEEFNNYLKLFPRFYDEEEDIEQEPVMPGEGILELDGTRTQSLDSLDSTLFEAANQ
jgi:hypothetical protein